MWVFFVVAAALAVLFALIVNRLASARHEQIERELEREEREILDRTGQRVEGHARGSYSIDGVVGGVPIRFQSNYWSRPPNDADEDHGRNACLVTVSADLPDFVVCRKEDASGVFGADLPAATTTGSARFDARFVGTFETTRAAAYRAPAGGTCAWSSPTLADILVDLDLQWIEVQKGAVKLVFAPMRATTVDRVLAAGASVARIAGGGTELPIAPGPADHGSPPPVHGAGSGALWVAFGVTLFFGPLSFLLGFLPPLRAAMSETCCGPGDEIVISSEEGDDGTSFSTECRDHPAASTVPLYLVSVSLWVTLAFTGAGVLGLTGWPRRNP